MASNDLSETAYGDEIARISPASSLFNRVSHACAVAKKCGDLGASNKSLEIRVENGGVTINEARCGMQREVLVDWKRAGADIDLYELSLVTRANFPKRSGLYSLKVYTSG